MTTVDMLLAMELDHGPPWAVAVGSYGKTLQIGVYVDSVLLDPSTVDSAVLVVEREIFDEDPITYDLTVVEDNTTINLAREWQLGDTLLEAPGIYTARVRVNVGGDILIFPDEQFRIIVS